MTTVGRKLIVAGTGVGMVLFLVAHMIGNLRAFEGAEALNEYAELLRFEPLLLWAARIGLLTFVVLHVAMTISLNAASRRARPEGYRKKSSLAANAASKTMVFGGLAILFYVVYHLLHFTVRVVHPDLVDATYVSGGHTHPDVHAGVVASFQTPWIAGIYVLAQVMLFFHLSHGVESACRTLGVAHPKGLTLARSGGRALALVITLGFLSVPVGVLAGVIR